MNHPQRLATFGNGSRWDEHPRGIVFTWHRGTADPAEPALPICIWLLPRCDLFFTAKPAKLFIRDNHDGDAVAPGCPVGTEKLIALGVCPSDENAMAVMGDGAGYDAGGSAKCLGGITKFKVALLFSPSNLAPSVSHRFSTSI